MIPIVCGDPEIGFTSFEFSLSGLDGKKCTVNVIGGDCTVQNLKGALKERLSSVSDDEEVKMLVGDRELTDGQKLEVVRAGNRVVNFVVVQKKNKEVHFPSLVDGMESLRECIPSDGSLTVEWEDASENRFSPFPEGQRFSYREIAIALQNLEWEDYCQEYRDGHLVITREESSKFFREEPDVFIMDLTNWFNELRSIRNYV